MAQSKVDKKVTKFVQVIEEKIELTDSEKEVFIKLKTAQLTKQTEVASLKTDNPAQFKKEVKKARKNFNTDFIKAVGKERAKEIIEATRKKKKKK